MAEGVAPRWLAARVVALLLGLIGLAERRGPQP
jgi:hypothetical protein